MPVIAAIRDNKDYIRALLYSYYTTITGWGLLLSYASLVMETNGRLRGGRSFAHWTV